MKIRHFFDPQTFTLTYVVFDEASRDAVIIDPVLDFDPLRAETSTASVDEVIGFVEKNGLRLHFVLETHAHADHLSGAQALKRRFGAKIVVGKRITEVQSTFRGIFALGPDFPVDGSQFDRLAEDGEVIEAGTLSIGVIATPGHTPACVTYRIEDAIFTGDTLFIEDYGTGRCDFPGGSAEALYVSVHERLYALPDSIRVFVGHDYQPGQRPLRWQTTIGASKRSNIQLSVETTKEDFLRFRRARDATLQPPRLLFPSVQVNVDAGRLPPPAGNGRSYLKTPIDLFKKTTDGR